MLPALFILLTVVAVYVVVALPEEVGRLRGEIAAALGYVTNWHLIFRDVSYFEALGRPPLLRHLWSLAVEEQFYIVWPLLFAAGMRFLGRRAFLVMVMAGVAASTALMWALFEPFADPSRVYFGADTRAAALLVGAALAFVWDPRGLAGRWSRYGGLPFDLIGAVALAALVVAVLSISEYGAFLYRGGFLLVALATAALIAATVHPQARIGRALGISVLRWVGVRSYAIYLWHWPIFMVTRPELDVALDGVALLALRIGITLALADLSYRLVERPVRRGDLGRLWEAMRRGRPAPPARLATTGAIVVAITVIALPALYLGPAQGTPSGSFGAVTAGAVDAADSRAVEAQPISSVGGARPSAPAFDESSPTGGGAAIAPLPSEATFVAASGRGSVSAPSEAVQAEPTHEAGSQSAPSHLLAVPGGPHSSREILAIGDSVMIGAEWELRGVFGSHVIVDADVGRHFLAGIEALLAHRAAGQVREVVVVHLGNNGPIWEEQFDEMMRVLADVPRVLFVNVKVPRRWERIANDAVASGVERWDNAELVDWRAASKGRGTFFAEDGLHLTREGARAYAEPIAEHLHAGG